MPHYTLTELAQFLNAELRGDPAITIVGINSLTDAKPGEISFLDNPRYRKYLAETKASAVILSLADLSECHTNALLSDKPYIAYAKLTHKFVSSAETKEKIHPTAFIGKGCTIHPTAIIGAGCVISDNVSIGAYTHLHPHVTVYHSVKIGERVIIHSGAVIGSDGFGFANENGRWIKIAQLGGVIIGSDVEIGANTTIDRGALNDTIIEDDVKLDNQIQIAHNVRIGAHTAIAACTGIAGSTTIGKYCLIGGGVGISGHIDIADKVVITAMSGVSKSITKAGTYSSGWPVMESRTWWNILARFRQLNK